MEDNHTIVAQEVQFLRAMLAPQPVGLPIAGLPSWRFVMEPHPDVAQGRYKEAEFAANLGQVARGEGGIEYLDPEEFFKRTYVTEGMKGLLLQALKRVSGDNGDPVIQLKTAFGGGKTHSMLALYHLMRGQAPLDKLPDVKGILKTAGLSALPRANVAVLVGTDLDPSTSREFPGLPGVSVSTVWGEMAAQLARNAGKPELYDLVREADKKGVSPGALTMKELFDACGPCLILMDEVVAYARKLHQGRDLPAGSFGNFLSFIQELTEAARTSQDSLVVATIPESKAEIGDEAGRKALDAIERVFGRMESVWRPVAPGEGFEVVRRRLFLDCKDPAARQEIANHFSRMYVENPHDFPIEAREADYRNRIISCYPIHPEFFDRLYEDWATLENFQRTRGVLRLMAAVIHELWMRDDASPLIMPGSIALDVHSIREELTKHLSGRESWNAILDREIDGKGSIPYQQDQLNPRFGNKLAARRVARAIMLGSAPTSRAQAVRGIERSHIRLGVVQPGEVIADFNDALNSLQNLLSFLYTDSSGERFWYDTRPTLRKTARDRMAQLTEADVEREIRLRLGKARKESPFAGVHPCPASSLDIPDEQAVRLVILGPDEEHSASRREESAALKACEDILNNRGNSPRTYRNMLVFVAPDQDQMSALAEEVRCCLAWKSIEKDAAKLNLDSGQLKEIKENVARYDESVDSRLQDAWGWLLVPNTDRLADIRRTDWQITRLSGGAGTIAARAARAMDQSEALITQWAPAPLKMELDAVLWRDAEDIAIKTLWGHLCTYCYLPRLAGYEVLEEAIKAGVSSGEFFALAEAKEGDRYLDLKLGCPVSAVGKSAWLVKREIARRQIEEDRREDTPTPPPIEPGGEGTPDPIPTPPPAPSKPKSTHFFLSAPLNNTRINRDVQRLVEDVISHLTSVDSGKVEVSLEISMTAPDGVPPEIVRAVSENCATMKFTNFGFND